MAANLSDEPTTKLAPRKLNDALKRTAILATSLIVVFAACGESNPGSDAAPEKPEPAQPVSPEEIAVTVTDEAFEFPATIEAEPVVLVTTNEGKQKHMMFFGKLHEDVSAEDVRKAMSKPGDAIFEVITLAGSASEPVRPGATSRMTIQFTQGSYFVVNPEAKGGPPPMGFFDVVPATGDEVITPEPDWVLEAGDMYFEHDGIRSGPSLVEVVNNGEQGHEVVINRTDKKGGTFLLAPAPGARMWVELDLEPGEYKALCFLPDEEGSGKNHKQLGMKSSFTID